jgi:curved DNA-binding protein CbpA
MKDHYATLGVNSLATLEKIRAAYHVLARKLHPDLHPGDKDSEDEFKRISLAYSVLSDPRQRERYDRELARPMPRTVPSPAGRRAGTSPTGFSPEFFRRMPPTFSTGPVEMGRAYTVRAGPRVGWPVPVVQTGMPAYFIFTKRKP